MNYTERWDAATRRAGERRLWWKNHGINIASVLLSIALTVLATIRLPQSWEWLWWVLLVAVALGVAAKEVFAFKVDCDFKTLMAEYRQAREYQRVSSRALTRLLEDLGRRISVKLGINDEHSRITFYGHSPNGFVPLARYSANPDIMSIGRDLYPDGQGVIWSAWTAGRAEFSSWGRHDESYEDMILRHVATGIPLDVVKKFKMKPRYMTGLRLSSDGANLGVVVIESEHRLRKDLALQLSDTGILNPILPVLRDLQPIFSDIAKQE